MDVRAYRVAASPEVRDLIERVLGEASCMAAMPEKQRCAAWRDEFFQRMKDQDVFVYVPFRFDCDVTKPLGIYWVDVCGAGVAFGHQFMLKEERGGWAAVACAKACWRAFLTEFQDVQLVMGLTPLDNPAAGMVAKRVGFGTHGTVKANGAECYLMVAERSVFMKGR